MKILFVSNDFIAGNLAYLLKKEGHEVKLYIENKKVRSTFENIVKKTNNWKKELNWVGKNGLIIFDDVGYGKIQDSLRKEGYTVFGGSFLGERLETEREYGQKIFKDYGIKTKELKDFSNIKSAIKYIKRNPGPWVIKQNENGDKTLNYVGYFKDGRDTISLLKNYSKKNIEDEKISLHKKIEGIEIGIGRFFNGSDWVGPIEYNIEHKKFFPGDLGPTTSEMGTLMWYDNNENNRLYKETISKIKPFLQETGFIGDFEINTIVNKSGAYALEATARLGSPAVHLQAEIHRSPWGEFLYKIAKGESYNLKWKKGYALIVLLATPPFPFGENTKDEDLVGVEVFFNNLNKKEIEHIRLDGLSKKTPNSKKLYLSDDAGYVLYVTNIGRTVEESRTKTYSIIKKIIIPKMMYRNDIGVKFIKEDYKKLKDWGYLD
ncbi:MAG: hypothetical protein PHT84_01510 [Candidatus Pacebacteria bacterium]|nr:hypothetical protein [Candidatus Paceibacterota bacterium]